MKTATTVLAVLLALGNVSFSNDKESKKSVKSEVTKTIKENSICPICTKGKYIVTYQNVIVYHEGQYVPIVNARFLKCTHCLDVKEDYIKR